MYNKMSQSPTYSILNQNKSRSASNDISQGIPCLTDGDIQFLTSMNEYEFEDYVSKVKSLISGNADEIVDSISTSNMQFLYEKLGGHSGLEKLLTFSESYLNSSGVINLTSLVPSGLNESQQQVYVVTAVMIDNVVRPYYEALTNFDQQHIRSRKNICDIQAGIELVLAGATFGVEQLGDAAMAGAGFALEGVETIALELEIARIRLDYEICNGRWH